MKIEIIPKTKHPIAALSYLANVTNQIIKSNNEYDEKIMKIQEELDFIKKTLGITNTVNKTTQS